MPPRAEVIGDPIAHSKSPAIHGFWLTALAIEGSYRAARVHKDELADYFAARRPDPDWRGCNLTAPLKEAVLPFLDGVEAEVDNIGAVNCVHRRDAGLIGLNSDVDGLAEALAGSALAGEKVAIIGSGGAARAALHHLRWQGARTVAVLARNPAHAAALAVLGGRDTEIRILPLERAAEAMAGSAAVINASPLGMAHAAPMPDDLLAALASTKPGAVALDMVYDPLDTPFLKAARAAGARPVDGLAMLIGQARKAFELFFDQSPPVESDGELRQLLIS